MVEFNDFINNCMLVGHVIKEVKRKGKKGKELHLSV